MPMTLEENDGQAPPAIAFIGRGKGLTAFLTDDGIAVMPAASTRESENSGVVRIALSEPQRRRKSSRHRKKRYKWHGKRKVRAESNYFIGRDLRLWRTHVAHFEQAEASDVTPGVSLRVYGNEEGIEFDLILEPGTDPSLANLQISGADSVHLDREGNLQLRIASSEIRVRKPAIYQLTAAARRERVEGSYILHSDGTIGFSLGPYSHAARLVLDPSLSIAYSTFLGGAGADIANSVALDSSGNIYVAGTTTSPTTFPEAGAIQLGPAGGAKDFFIAKIDPSTSGSSSLLYLTFLGGSGNQAGGVIALDPSNNDLALMGTSTSIDYPVTDGSSRTSGSNDLVVTEIDPSGAKLVYSTLFGGSGAEATQNPGGIAIDSLSSIYVASDTNSADLTTTTGAYQTAYGGGISDGFLAIFHPLVTPHLEYCTYFGINAQVGIGGVAVDSGSNTYIAGYTSNPTSTFPTLNGFQMVYGGDPYDAFLIKIHSYGTGSTDLGYGTFLGGSGLDKAFAISLGASLPATAYVTGTTESTNFPLSTASTGFQASLKGTANAFLAVVTENAVTGMTSLAYSTYLGGSQSDTGLSVIAAEPNEIYVAGNTTSFDFPWQDNFQPFNGNTDAFVAKLDPTMSGAASLLYTTPLAGTAPPGQSAVSNGNSIAADGAGHVYVVGQTVSADFPRAGSPVNGFQLLCTSCQASPPAADAFVVEIQESTATAPSASFTAQNLNFGQQTIGAQNIPPLFASITNTGDATLNVSSLGIVGTNSSDFALAITEPCMTAPIPPGANCGFEVSFIPSVVGPEGAFLAFTDDAPGNPQVLQLEGVGGGPLGVPTPASQNFGTVSVGASSSVTITLANAGNQNLIISNFTLGGPAISQFSIQGLSCLGGTVVIPQAACSSQVVFTPTAVGSYSAQVTITDNSGGVAGTQQVIPLSGTGTAPAPAVNLAPGALNFGQQAVGTTSGPQAITLTNVGGATLSLTGFPITGGDAASFTIVSSAGSNPCPPSGGTLAVSAFCTVTLNFTPQSGGTKNASLRFSDNAAGSPQSVAISGTGVSSTIQLSPTSLNFAPQSVGTGTSQSVAVASSGNVPIGFSSISVSGVNAADFTQTNTCFPVIGTPGSCTINVTFNPMAAGNRSATLTLVDNAVGSPQMVALTGVATAAGILLSPTSINFSNQVVGTPSSPVTITVTNTGQGALVINPLSPNSFTGTNAGDFSQTNTCSGSILPGGSCAIQITFNPQCANISAARTATLTLSDNAPGNIQTILLAGTATGNFCMAPQSVGGNSVTIAAGQVATYQLNLISLGGYVGSLTMSCNDAITASTCTVAPETASLEPNSLTQIQVSATTTAPALASTVSARRRTAATPKMRTSNILVLIGLCLLPILLALARPKPQNGHSCRLSRRIRTCLVSFAILPLAACGGNSTGTDPSSGTPPGSYTLSVSATTSSPTSAQTLGLSLTVTSE